MENMIKIGTLFGHRDSYLRKEEIENLKNVLIECIEKRNISIFYLGGRGSFDSICQHILKELKVIYPHIKLILIFAYYKPNLSIEDRHYIEYNFDGTIYPPIENVFKKWAISHRNRWMIDNADFIIFYVNERNHGGARSALHYAKAHNKEFINLYNDI